MNDVEVQGHAPRLALTVLAALHLTVVLWHGAAHSGLAVSLSRLQTLFVFGVILIAPLVATLLLWTRLEEFAVWVYAIAMFASLLFGAYYHYIVVSPDNVHYLPPGSDAARHGFSYSAGAVAVIELVATLYGGAALLSQRSALDG